MKKNRLKAIILSVFATICLGIGVSSCSDDSPTVIPPVGGDPFSIEFRVVDPAGDPVEGIQLTLYNDHDYLQKSANKAANAVRFSMATEARAVLYVVDVEGDTVRTLVDGMLAAGQHSVTWDGRDSGGVRQNSGRFDYHLRFMADGATVSFADSVGVLLSQPDSDFFIATTDSTGSIVLDDKRLFPQLYSLPEMMAVDETATALGAFNVTGAMHAIYRDPVAGLSIHATLDVLEGTDRITQVWDPVKATSINHGSGFMQSTASEKPRMGLSSPTDLVDGQLLAYPNPFN